MRVHTQSNSLEIVGHRVYCFSDLSLWPFSFSSASSGFSSKAESSDASCSQLYRLSKLPPLRIIFPTSEIKTFSLFDLPNQMIVLGAWQPQTPRLVQAAPARNSTQQWGRISTRWGLWATWGQAWVLSVWGEWEPWEGWRPLQSNEDLAAEKFSPQICRYWTLLPNINTIWSGRFYIL